MPSSFFAYFKKVLAAFLSFFFPLQAVHCMLPRDFFFSLHLSASSFLGPSALSSTHQFLVRIAYLQPYKILSPHRITNVPICDIQALLGPIDLEKFSCQSLIP
ncbi:hypothetical protein BDP55DRAFT_338964 [Colletotrichum godetiae]|uniref:Uncharacterized protein n=1 Tax=Colletotrichum godetiae TaxID=1209918 RepID=A0AAJ0EZY3_9PEZI|nr:uncharacterized protein BDP55DRAFT_338964 [Colletotrichum godetiae]KAK1690101.1 hypothetical protein BDP55DRAFT_338964 [Colletotrichum godetiae]